MKGYLVDTNVISEATKSNPHDAVTTWLKDTPGQLLYLSTLTIGEIEQGIQSLPSGKKRASLKAWLERIVMATFASRILAVDIEIARKWGELAARAAKSGVRAIAVDGLIAATARVHDLAVATRNTSDFAAYEVQVINPWQYRPRI